MLTSYISDVRQLQYFEMLPDFVDVVDVVDVVELSYCEIWT